MAQIIWTEHSKKNLKAIHSYIASDSLLYANRFITSLISATQKLEIFPECGKKVPALLHLSGAIREVIYKNYRIIYQIKENKSEVVILTVVHNRRNLADLPKQDWEL